MDKCPKCEKNDMVEINKKGVNCLCDLDFCEGQRCGANNMIESYRCKRCNQIFTSEQYKHYVEYRCNND
ncbi:MAG: hypothetical protein CVU90_15660 [Firmicutes bacterium HGW-Firmicutes-15]|nr:MAG: hypothetical protein CVU90_15660 [Firmicutes bacterium HGW-Firmicutes-15]